MALSTEDPHIAFFAGLATAIGAAVSMGFSEALSDTGEFTGRGNPWERGRDHGRRHVHRRRLPHAAVPDRPLPRGDHRGIITVAVELVVLAVIRARFFRTGFLRSFATVTLGGAIIVGVAAALGSAA